MGLRDHCGTVRHGMWMFPLLASLAATAPAAAAGPFDSFSGQWSGSGEAAMADGSHERIRCKARYSVSPGGEKLNINVNCASDATRVNIISNVVAQGSGFSGTWRETTRQVQGDVQGRIPAPGEFQATLGGTGFSIEMSATARGDRQAVTIRSQGTDVQSVSMTLRRG